ncbi:hypothetical protein ABW19_dt0204971 [Dactylella cylindrospora]|nr:hypothetical protein ABW19_dt0204971 [Dactylella cylindrospora]
MHERKPIPNTACRAKSTRRYLKVDLLTKDCQLKYTSIPTALLLRCNIQNATFYRAYSFINTATVHQSRMQSNVRNTLASAQIYRSAHELQENANEYHPGDIAVAVNCITGTETPKDVLSTQEGYRQPFTKYARYVYKYGPYFHDHGDRSFEKLPAFTALSSLILLYSQTS